MGWGQVVQVNSWFSHSGSATLGKVLKPQPVSSGCWQGVWWFTESVQLEQRKGKSGLGEGKRGARSSRQTVEVAPTGKGT